LLSMAFPIWNRCPLPNGRSTTATKLAMCGRSMYWRLLLSSIARGSYGRSVFGLRLDASPLVCVPDASVRAFDQVELASIVTQPKRRSSLSCNESYHELPIGL